MKFKTIDGKEFDCELEALRHENDVLIERLNRAKGRINQAYGNAFIYPHTKQAQMYREAIKNMVCKHDVNAIRMDTDSFFYLIPEDDDVQTPVDFTQLPTWAMVDELAKRTGVQEIDVEHDSQMELVDIESGVSRKIPSPSRVLVVVD